MTHYCKTICLVCIVCIGGFPGGSGGREFAGVTRQTWVQSLGQEKSPEEGNGYPHQYSCLENPMDRGAWWTTVHGVTKS